MTLHVVTVVDRHANYLLFVKWIMAFWINFLTSVEAWYTFRTTLKFYRKNKALDYVEFITAYITIYFRSLLLKVIIIDSTLMSAEKFGTRVRLHDGEGLWEKMYQPLTHTPLVKSSSYFFLASSDYLSHSNLQFKFKGETSFLKQTRPSFTQERFLGLIVYVCTILVFSILDTLSQHTHENLFSSVSQVVA